LVRIKINEVVMEKHEIEEILFAGVMIFASIVIALGIISLIFKFIMQQ
jgi:F0F1-type ATP synthase membrane subunit c/vacuolar-type H+-ATPase subunit K